MRFEYDKFANVQFKDFTGSRLPEEAKVLPPTNIFNPLSVYFGLLGYAGGLLHNGLNRRPTFRAGIHRQLLYTSVMFFVGYHLSVKAAYVWAKRDRDLEEYVKLHPEHFPEKEPPTYAAVSEPWEPV